MNINRTPVIMLQTLLALIFVVMQACSSPPDNMVVVDGVLHVMNTEEPLDPDPRTRWIQSAAPPADGQQQS